MIQSDRFAKWNPFDSECDFPRHAGPPPHQYLIASTQRSGSYLLSYLLRETGQLGFPLEYLHPEHAPMWQQRFGVSSLNEVILNLFERRTSPNGWFGIKAHWPHYVWARKQGVDDLLRFGRFIRMEREDRLAQAVSLALARKTGAWVSLQQKDAAPAYDDAAISGALDTLDRDSRAWDEWARTNGAKSLHIVYEELVADPLGVVNHVLREFGLDEVDSLPPVPLQKQASAVNGEWIRRYNTRTERMKRMLKRAGKSVLPAKAAPRPSLRASTGGRVR
ncbi:MAG TPA: Stf0 family sulfotransferase [Sphingomicrobium sp.]|nr:Stf0 family sulfotransferase [Sphingomicrobium sp.]